MFLKFWTWIKAIGEGWKIISGIIAAVVVIGTASIKLNKGIAVMTETATNVKLLMKSDTLQSKDIAEIKKTIKTEIAVRGAQEESYVDHLKLENRLNEVIQFYERKVSAETEKKNLNPIP
jgi:hypothetical protein